MKPFLSKVESTFLTCFKFPFKHLLHVIATDGHDVEPETAQSIVISSGERYDVLVQTKPYSMKNYFIQLGDMEVKNRQDVQRNIDVISYLCLRFF